MTTRTTSHVCRGTCSAWRSSPTGTAAVTKSPGWTCACGRTAVKVRRPGGPAARAGVRRPGSGGGHAGMQRSLGCDGEELVLTRCCWLRERSAECRTQEAGISVISQASAFSLKPNLCLIRALTCWMSVACWYPRMTHDADYPGSVARTELSTLCVPKSCDCTRLRSVLSKVWRWACHPCGGLGTRGGLEGPRRLGPPSSPRGSLEFTNLAVAHVIFISYFERNFGFIQTAIRAPGRMMLGVFRAARVTLLFCGQETRAVLLLPPFLEETVLVGLLCSLVIAFNRLSCP